MNRPELTEADWIEIYYALDTKADMIEKGDYDEEDPVDTWLPHLREIIKKIGPDGKNMYQREPNGTYGDANLLAAAPKLLAACKEAEKIMTDFMDEADAMAHDLDAHDVDTCALCQLRAAIAAAEGDPLCAAAPELLAVLQDVEAWWTGGDCPDELWERIKAVLNRAEGKVAK